MLALSGACGPYDSASLAPREPPHAFPWGSHFQLDRARSAVWQAILHNHRSHTSKNAPCQAYVADGEYRRQSADTMMIAQMLARSTARANLPLLPIRLEWARCW